MNRMIIEGILRTKSISFNIINNYIYASEEFFVMEIAAHIKIFWLYAKWWGSLSIQSARFPAF